MSVGGRKGMTHIRKYKKYWITELPKSKKLIALNVPPAKDLKNLGVVESYRCDLAIKKYLNRRK